MELNRKLAIAAVALTVLSAFTYWNDARRVDRFQRGQKLISNLNPDEISRIEISSAAGSVSLARTADGYRIEEENGYRAKNETVNRLVRDLLELSLARGAGSGPAIAEELGLEPLAEDGVEVALLGATGQEMVRLRVGGETEDGTARYVTLLDEQGTPESLYVSEGQVRIDTEPEDYLRKEIVDVQASQIVRAEGPDFVLAKDEDGAVVLEGPGEEDTAKTREVKAALSRLQFDKVFVADDPAVATLDFQQGLRLDLDDDSGYLVSVAERDGTTFLQVQGFLSVDRVEVSEDDTEEELQDKSQVLRRNNEIIQFNAFHGSWTYALDETSAEPFSLRRSDLIQ